MQSLMQQIHWPWRGRVCAVALCSGIALSIACGGEARSTADQPLGGSAMTSIYGAVLPPSEGRKLLAQCSRSTPSLVPRFWVPPNSVIAEMEQRLPSVVAGLPVQRAHLDSLYVRQYLGLVRLNGKRTVYVNAIDKGYIASLNRMRRQLSHEPAASSGDTVSWRLVPIVVCDGGGRFWGVEYDQDSQKFKPVQISQVAG
jgi:hypothetical protein